MDNRINFTGTKNISYCMDKGKKATLRYISAELTGQDLHAFKKAVKKSGFDLYVYSHPYADNFINICTAEVDKNKALLINDVPVELIDESLPLFQFAAKLTRRIAARKNIVLEKEYQDSFMFNHAPALGQNIENPIKFYDTELVQKGAKRFNNFIQKIMDEYFEV